MMYELEMPFALPCSRIKRDDRCSKEICANAVDSIEIVSWRSERNVSNATSCIDRHFAPVVGATDVFPGILRPGFVAILTRAGHRVECPHQLAGTHIVSADITRWRHVPLARRAAEDDEILKHLARSVRLDVTDR